MNPRLQPNYTTPNVRLALKPQPILEGFKDLYSVHGRDSQVYGIPVIRAEVTRYGANNRGRRVKSCDDLHSILVPRPTGCMRLPHWIVGFRPKRVMKWSRWITATTPRQSRCTLTDASSCGKASGSADWGDLHGNSRNSWVTGTWWLLSAWCFHELATTTTRRVLSFAMFFV